MAWHGMVWRGADGTGQGLLWLLETCHCTCCSCILSMPQPTPCTITTEQVVKVYVSVYSDERGKIRAMDNLKRLEGWVGGGGKH